MTATHFGDAHVPVTADLALAGHQRFFIFGVISSEAGIRRALTFVAASGELKFH